MARPLLTIVETPTFTRLIVDQDRGDAYRGLQLALAANPKLGVVVAGSGGIRKVRWGLPGQGKRGGLRVLYFWSEKTETILMLFVFPKNVMSDLTKAQLKLLRAIVEKEFK